MLVGGLTGPGAENAYGGSALFGLGLTGLDFAGDIRDLTYDITHWDGSLKHAGQTLLDVVGLIPGKGETGDGSVS